MEPPSITLTSEEGNGITTEVVKKTIKFQCGLLRETETFTGEDLEVLCKDTLLDYVCDMLTNKVSGNLTSSVHVLVSAVPVANLCRGGDNWDKRPVLEV